MITDAISRRPAIPVRKRKATRARVKKFIMGSCGVKTLDESLPITTLRPDVIGGEKPYYTVVSWVESKFGKRLDNEFVESKTIGELINAMSAD